MFMFDSTFDGIRNNFEM